MSGVDHSGAVPLSNLEAELRGARRMSRVCNALICAVLLGLFACTAHAQSPAPHRSPYAFTNDLFVGGVFTRAASGPNLDDTNFGGWNVSGTHYFTPRLGATADVQGFYGHAPIETSNFTSSDPLVSKYVFLAGPQYRWRTRPRYSSSIRLLAGAIDTDADTPSARTLPAAMGLYANATKFAFKPGLALDVNITPRMAFRYSGGVLLERQNGDLQKDFNLSVGLLFRLGR